jgi:hypothetical protein
MLHSLFLSGNCSTCFGWYHHQSSGAQKTVSTAFAICHTVIERVKFTDKVYKFILSGNCSTCFGRFHHPSLWAQTTVSAASVICHTVMDRVKCTDKVYKFILSGNCSTAFLLQCQRPGFTPMKTTGKIIVLYILIFKFLDNNLVHHQNTLCKTIMKHLVPSLKWVLWSVLLYFKF